MAGHGDYAAAVAKLQNEGAYAVLAAATALEKKGEHVLPCLTIPCTSRPQCPPQGGTSAVLCPCWYTMLNLSQSRTKACMCDPVTLCCPVMLAGRDIIHFEIGQPDYPTPKHVVEVQTPCLPCLDDGRLRQDICCAACCTRVVVRLLVYFYQCCSVDLRLARGDHGLNPMHGVACGICLVWFALYDAGRLALRRSRQAKPRTATQVARLTSRHVCAI